MTKTGIIALSLGLGIPTVVVGSTAISVAVLTPKGEDTGIDPQIIQDEHVSNVLHTPIIAGKDFKVKITNLEQGWAKISSSSTVTIGGKSVPFTYEDDATIVVKSGYVTGEPVTLDIKAEKTVKSMTAVWKKQPPEWFTILPCYFTSSTGKPSATNDDTVVAADFDVYQLKGDDTTWEKAEPYSESNPDGYRVQKKVLNSSELVDITPSLTKSEEPGYVVTEEKDMAKKTSGDHKITVMYFTVSYKNVNFEYSNTLEAICGNHVDSITLDPDDVERIEDPFVSGEEYYFGAQVSPAGAFNYYKMEVDSSTSLPTGTTFENGILKAGSTAGTFKFNVISRVDETKTAGPYTVTISVS